MAQRLSLAAGSSCFEVVLNVDLSALAENVVVSTALGGARDGITSLPA